jgi:hypothetical protein
VQWDNTAEPRRRSWAWLGCKALLRFMHGAHRETYVVVVVAAAAEVCDV